MNEKLTPSQPNYSEYSNAKLRIAEASQIARLIAIDFKATFIRAAIFATSVIRRMRGEPAAIDWDPNLEDINPELAEKLHEEEKKYQLIFHETNRRRSLGQSQSK